MRPRVLIVDDSLTVRMDLKATFESAGIATTLCATLADARAALASEDLSLVILDVVLPDGDGIDLLREIKDHPSTSKTPVLLLSNEAEVGDRVRGLKTGADDYVGKPYDASYVLSCARRLMGLAGCARQHAAPQVLLIDDCLTFREEFKSVLEAQGYRVATAQAGEEGVRAAIAVRPDIVVVDAVMPGPLEGTAVIRRLKQDVALRHTPCLLLTGSEQPGDELRALETGADAYQRKSADMPVILARIAALLRPGSASPLGCSSFSSLLTLRKVLTVDDSPTYLHELGSELRKDGYDVIPATSGREAVELLESQPVDCILLDLLMPELTGKETCKIIKSKPEWRNIPLLILTSLEDPQSMIEGINAGADDYVPKSSHFEVVKARVRAQLRRKQFEDECHFIQQELLRKGLEAAEAKAAQQVAETRAALVEELERKNRELEAFSYSVSHDLRAPVRAIAGFSRVLLQEYVAQLPAKAQEYLRRVNGAALRMGDLIDALLHLSRIGRAELKRGQVDISQLARGIIEELRQSDPVRSVEFVVAAGLEGDADRELVSAALSNLLENAWKFTGHRPDAKIEVGALRHQTETAYFVRDNGIGFDPAHGGRLFAPFVRLHAASEFPGSGIGLATVARIIERHGGRVWAEGESDRGATFFFTLPSHGRS